MRFGNCLETKQNGYYSGKQDRKRYGHASTKKSIGVTERPPFNVVY
jgi:hypothetical protein